MGSCLDTERQRNVHLYTQEPSFDHISVMTLFSRDENITMFVIIFGGCVGQHRRFPGGLVILMIVLILPGLVLAFINSAANADECQAQKTPNHGEQAQKPRLKCP